VSPYRPLVAVVAYHLANDRVTRWPSGGFGVPAPYIDRVRAAGARTAILVPGEEGDAEELLRPFDGLLLVGGGDVDPARYGQAPGQHLYAVEPDRDGSEIALLRAADAMRLPTLCICRGMQVMNVAWGGTLHQHLPDLPGLLPHGVPVEDTESRHEVRIAPDSRLLATAGTRTLSCSSHHHQGVDRVGEGLTATGWSPDGLIEAIERTVEDPERDVWMLGVQWHPEDTAPDDPAQRALFEGFVNLARWRGSRAKPGEAGGRTRSFEIADPDPAWASWFEEEAAAIGEAMGGLALRVEHVGSTSIPGLAAKPIIDIQVSVASLVPRGPVVTPLTAIGYRHQIDPLETGHEYLSKGYDGGARPVHIHLCETGSDWERRHIAFRDWLRSHPEDAVAYADLKRRLASAHPNDILTYVDGKSGFIREIEIRAAERTAGYPLPDPAGGKSGT
jgi:putative glutamine amidotransferase